VNPNRADTHYYVEYGRSDTPKSFCCTEPPKRSSLDPDAGAGANSLGLKEVLNHLQPGEQYHYRIVAYNAFGTRYGFPIYFRTLAPRVIAVAPKEGPAVGGTSVSIDGEDFYYITAVRFTGTNALRFSVNSPSSITAVSPSGAVGTGDISVVAESGGVRVVSRISSRDQFTYFQHVPVKLEAPAILPPVPRVGAPEQASAGSWQYLPSSYAYQWFRCGKKCRPEPHGSNSAKYTPERADARKTLVVQVTASNVYGPSEPVKSAPTERVVLK
jgi:hypothetical protein